MLILFYWTLPLRDSGLSKNCIYIKLSSFQIDVCFSVSGWSAFLKSSETITDIHRGEVKKCPLNTEQNLCWISQKRPGEISNIRPILIARESALQSKQDRRPSLRPALGN